MYHLDVLMCMYVYVIYTTAICYYPMCCIASTITSIHLPMYQQHINEQIQRLGMCIKMNRGEHGVLMSDSQSDRMTCG